MLAHSEPIAESASRRLTTVAAVKVPDRNLHELREQGFTIVEGFLAPDELNTARRPCGCTTPDPRSTSPTRQPTTSTREASSTGLAWRRGSRGT